MHRDGVQQALEAGGFDGISHDYQRCRGRGRPRLRGAGSTGASSPHRPSLVEDWTWRRSMPVCPWVAGPFDIHGRPRSALGGSLDRVATGSNSVSRVDGAPPA
jgi:hypothetical protein